MTQAGGNKVINYLRRTLCADAHAGAPDEQLLEQFVAQRDEAAFAALLRRHGPMVWGVCRRLLTHHQDAEDAFQATFLVLAGKAASIRRRKLVANWLFGVARRAALNVRAMRTRRTRQEQLCGNLPDVPAPLETSRDDVRTVVDEELARMPEKYRLPLLLCGLEGMTHAEAGQHLGWPTGTVAGRLSRGRALLRTRLFRRGVTAPAALTTVFAPDAASAAVLPLVAASVRNAAAFITVGKPAAAVVAPAVATLMRRVLWKMFLSRLWTATALVAALAVTLGGAGVVWYRTPSKEASPTVQGSVAPKRLPSPVAVHSGSRRPAPKTAGKPAIRLPTDPDAVVLRMDRSVDFSTTLRTVLTVYADGRVVAEVPDGVVSLAPTDLTQYAKSQMVADDPDGDPDPPNTKRLEGRLSTQELEELLRFALHDEEFFDFDAGAVRAAIRDQYQADGSATDSTDATTTSFRIQTADRNHEVSWSRLDKAAWDFPKVERLLQLHAVDRRLSQVFYVVLAGGPEPVQAAAAKMNELVRPYYDLYPDAPRLTAADLFRVSPSADGAGMEFTFSRNRDKAVRHPLFEVSIAVPPQGEPTLRYVMPPSNLARSPDRRPP
jgi:RNA polymerase sigma factor (sigma-70 family)